MPFAVHALTPLNTTHLVRHVDHQHSPRVCMGQLQDVSKVHKPIILPVCAELHWGQAGLQLAVVPAGGCAATAA